MKGLIVSVLLLGSLYLSAQTVKTPDYTGQYQVDFYPARKMNVYQEGNQLKLEIVGQGKTEIIPKGDNRFSAKLIPGLTIIFKVDSQGHAYQFSWLRKKDQVTEWIRAKANDTAVQPSSQPLGIYEGKYSVKGNSYLSIQIRADSDHLVSLITGETELPYYPLSGHSFIFKKGDLSSVYEFFPDKNGKITRFKLRESGPVVCSKFSDINSQVVSAKHSFTQRTGFSLADTLQGSLSPLRSCYDVLFYDLDLTVVPDSQFINAKNIIRFRSVKDFAEMQVDLFANMKIEKIIFQNISLPYTRKYDAVFIQFPQTIKEGSVEEIQIFYSGKPQLPEMARWAGGFIWANDKNGKPWIETVVQGSGASVWWPCKDHLSDKPDSMNLTVTVPSGLTAISNGRMIGKTDVPGKQTRYQWAVGYPINTYNTVLYIGDYVHFSDEYNGGNSRFPLNFYCLSYEEQLARWYPGKVKSMLQLYEKDFGPYPYPKDGYALVESPYGMEHQSAVSIGVYSDPSTGKTLDSTEQLRTLWHESAHEWWGNSVTCSDYADFWIHESFASYAEILCYEYFDGEAAGRKYILEQKPDNKEPIIGFYGVNDFHMGDMYPKGGRMIATLRNIISNDSVFFGILRGIQSKYKYQTVNTGDIIQYFNQASGVDLTYIFDQYLRHASIPRLHVSLQPAGKDLELKYRWEADVSDFRLPVKVLTADNQTAVIIYPGQEWKTTLVPNMKKSEFKVDNIYSYFDLKTD
jgi:Peptidase family M1 domain/Peptidase M1 N-terminal domain